MNIQYENEEANRIGKIVDDIIQQDLFVCINGVHLFMKCKDNHYTMISTSENYEIMQLKALLVRHNLRVTVPDCKLILEDLKTEESIWATRLEETKDEKYNILFLGGKELCGVSGDFNGYLGIKLLCT